VLNFCIFGDFSLYACTQVVSSKVKASVELPRQQESFSVSTKFGTTNIMCSGIVILLKELIFIVRCSFFLLLAFYRTLMALVLCLPLAFVHM